jgi:hypothetical protein
MKSKDHTSFLRSLGIRGRIRTFLVRMQFGTVQPAAPFWERMAAPA